MKKAIAIIVAMLFVFAVASIAIAAEKAVAPGEKKVEEQKVGEKKVAEKPKQFTGEISKIDLKEKKIVTLTKKVKDKVTEAVFAVDDKTVVMIGKDKKALTDLKVGDKAGVKFEEKDGKKIAKSIIVKAAEKVEKKEMKKVDMGTENSVPIFFFI
jgi:Cu/Ag efflux protein CusF